MKRIFIIAVLLASPGVAWAGEDAIQSYDIAQMKKEIAYQQKQIDSLERRLGDVVELQFQAHNQPTISVQHPAEPLRETASQMQDRIEKESELEQAVVGSETNRDEIYWMQHKY